jgi:hypothetical protein
MADNYLFFSEVVPNLTAEEEAWLTSQLSEVAVHGDTEVVIEDYDDAAAKGAQWVGIRVLRDYEGYDPAWDSLEFQYAFDDDNRKSAAWGRHLWIYAEDNGNVEQVAWLVQKFLKQFHPDHCWSLTYANTCSKARVGEFGGGAVFVTADEIRFNDCYDFVEEQRKVFERSQQHDLRLIRKAEELGIEPELLDEAVHDAADSAAASINNAGVDDQITYLIEQCGPEETEELLVGLLDAEESEDGEDHATDAS